MTLIASIGLNQLKLGVDLSGFLILGLDLTYVLSSLVSQPQVYHDSNF